MTHEHTSYHSPISLADARASRTERARRVAPDFAFGEPVQKNGPRFETADERAERLMASLRAAEGKATRWQRWATAAACALCAAVVLAGLFHLLRS